MVSEKLTFFTFSHFKFFSKSVHPLTTSLLWEVHNDDRNMFKKFEVNLIYRLGAMEKTSRCPAKIQHQQHEGVNLKDETDFCNLDPARGYLHKKKSHTLDSKKNIA